MTSLMKALIIFLFAFLFSFAGFTQTNPKHVYVAPYVRSNGTVVSGHYKTSPNSTNRDNFSTKPNVNPYTGKPGYIEPDTKLINQILGDYNPNNSFNTNGEINPIKIDNSNSLSDFKDIKISNFDYGKSNISSYYDAYPTYAAKLNLSMRQQMSFQSAIILNIPKGSTVKVINSFFGDWWEVLYNDERGYVPSTQLDFKSSDLNAGSLSSLYDSYPSYKTKIEVNMREHMSTKTAIIFKIPKGATVKVINSFFGDWWEVSFFGKRGYVRSNLLTK